MPWYSSDLDTFSTPLEYPLSVAIAWNSTITEFKSIMEQRVSLQDVERYSFSGRTTHLDSTDLATLTELWIDCKGRMIPMKWVHENSTRYVRFNMAALTMENIFTTYWKCDISLIDVHPSEIIVDD